MKILVAGGAGFIGYHLTRHLHSLGHQILVVDNFSTGSKRNLLDPHNCIELDISGPDAVNILMEHQADLIINLACPASPVAYQKNPFATLDTNYVGVKNLLTVANANYSRFLQASTSEIYGDPLHFFQSERWDFGNVNTLGPRSCYDEGKRVAEALCYEFNHFGKVDIRIARIFNTYGPFMAKDDGRVISNFIVAALKNEPIKIYGNGKQTRSFCYVSDMVEGLTRLALKDDNTLSVLPINLGNPDPIDMNTLALKIKSEVGSSSQIVKEIPLQDDPKQRCPDTRRAQEKLNWKPVITLQQGLNKTIEHFREVL